MERLTVALAVRRTFIFSVDFPKNLKEIMQKGKLLKLLITEYSQCISTMEISTRKLLKAVNHSVTSINKYRKILFKSQGSLSLTME